MIPDVTYLDTIEALEGFCRAMRHDLARGNRNAVAATARSMVGRCFDLVQYAGIDEASKDMAQPIAPKGL